MATAASTSIASSCAAGGSVEPWLVVIFRPENAVGLQCSPKEKQHNQAGTKTNLHLPTVALHRTCSVCGRARDQEGRSRVVGKEASRSADVVVGGKTRDARAAIVM